MVNGSSADSLHKKTSQDATPIYELSSLKDDDHGIEVPSNQSRLNQEIAADGETKNSIDDREIQTDPNINEIVTERVEDPSQYFRIKLIKDKEIAIFKPLLPLKCAWLFWAGGMTAVSPYLSVYLKQRGLTITEFSSIYAILPIVHFLLPTISGIIIDKIGRSKPILIINAFLPFILLGSIVLVPSMKYTDCDTMHVHLTCETNNVNAMASCGLETTAIRVEHCQTSCVGNNTEYCHSSDCEFVYGTGHNFSLDINLNGSHFSKVGCFYSVHSIVYNNLSQSQCKDSNDQCSISCSLPTTAKCSIEATYRKQLFVITLVLMVLFISIYSNCFRMLEVATAALITEHNKDFGQQRVLSKVGSIFIPLVSGYVVTATTREGEPNNYVASFYIFFGLSAFTAAALWKVEVPTKPPGKRMLKNTILLLRKPKFLSFLLVIFFLGTAKSVFSTFANWYLTDLSAPSLLLGLRKTFNAIYTLPFYQTSNWWISRIGRTNVFVLAFLGRGLSFIGYSFMTNPWWALAVELLDIITVCLFWTAVVLHCNAIAPESLTSTLIASSGGVYQGIGKGCGSLIAGQLMSAFGARAMYKGSAVTCFVFGLLYFIYLRFDRTEDVLTDSNDAYRTSNTDEVMRSYEFVS